jgi:hypothetical protein
MTNPGVRVACWISFTFGSLRKNPFDAVINKAARYLSFQWTQEIHRLMKD